MINKISSSKKCKESGDWHSIAVDSWINTYSSFIPSTNWSIHKSTMKCTHRHVNDNVSRIIKTLEQRKLTVWASKENIFYLLLIKLLYRCFKAWIHCSLPLKRLLFSVKQNIYYILGEVTWKHLALNCALRKGQHIWTSFLRSKLV